MEESDTIIVGAGMAGMTCACKLKEAGLHYTLVSPNIGGRIKYLKEYEMNFGAVFYMKRYTNARKLLVPGKLVLPSFFDLECHKTLGKGYGVLSTTMIAAVPQLIRFLKYLTKTFQPQYSAFKSDCETMEMRAAMAKSPYIKELFETSATDLIERERFPKAAEAVVSQFVYACTGTKISLLNALDYLNCAQGIIDSATRFSFDAEATEEILAENNRVIKTSVTNIKRADQGWSITTAENEEHCCKNLVLASPADVTERLLEPITGPYETRAASELHAYKVRGRIKPEYAGHPLHLFDQNIPLINIGKRPDNAYEVFTCKPLDMGIFFDEYTIEHRVDWPQALFTHPSLLLDQSLGDGLYRAGDHNALGLEPAAISGIFVANEIARKAQEGTSHV